MKKNADERNYTTVDEIENDIITTLAGWTEDHREEWVSSVNGVKALISDWFVDYELTDEEVDEINAVLVDFFTEE